jgi:hypothetical protein
LHATLEQSIGIAAAGNVEPHNPIEIHDGIAMYAYKAVGVEESEQSRKRMAKLVAIAGCIKPNVVAGCSDPLDLADWQKEKRVLSLHCNPFQRRPFGYEGSPSGIQSPECLQPETLHLVLDSQQPKLGPCAVAAVRKTFDVSSGKAVL